MVLVSDSEISLPFHEKQSFQNVLSPVKIRFCQGFFDRIKPTLSCRGVTARSHRESLMRQLWVIIVRFQYFILT